MLIAANFTNFQFPKYGYMMQIPLKSVNYSYDVVLFEVLTGKQPIEATIPVSAIVLWELPIINTKRRQMSQAPQKHTANVTCIFDIMVAMGVAISHSMNILSLSLDRVPIRLYDTSIATGSFQAREKGISVLRAATYNDPTTLSVANEAPWIDLIGASTLDRKFTVIVHCHVPVYLFLFFRSDQLIQWDPGGCSLQCSICIKIT